ncbi:MAG: DUF2312 domain-containing protein [Magnetococcales bacterium]|nr:DUF2312 domain-containing protein [Magnetococcales bacterium]
MPVSDTGNHLLGFVTRIEQLSEEKMGISADIRAVFIEAKSAGFDSKIMRMLIKIREMDRSHYKGQEDMLDLYKHLIGIE